MIPARLEGILSIILISHHQPWLHLGSITWGALKMNHLGVCGGFPKADKGLY